MKLLVIAGLNKSLIRAKLLPLIKTEWVESITCINRHPGPEVPYVEYLVAPCNGGIIARNYNLFSIAVREVKKKKPDIILAYNVVPYAFIAHLLSLIFNIPMAINVIGGPLEIEGGGYQTDNRVLSKLSQPNHFIERMLILILKSAYFVTTTGSCTKQYLIKKGLNPRIIFPISSVIDPNLFFPKAGKKQYNIACISSLIVRKRIHLLIELIAEIAEHYKNVKVAVIGEGPLRASLEQKTKNLKITDNVDFLGFQDDVRQTLWSSKIYLMTSFLEGLPLSLIEAMACGLAPVTGDFGDVTDLIQDRQNGRVVSTKNAIMYKNALMELLEHDDLRQGYAIQAVKTVKNGYTIETATAKWNRLYNELLKKNIK